MADPCRQVWRAPCSSLPCNTSHASCNRKPNWSSAQHRHLGSSEYPSQNLPTSDVGTRMRGDAPPLCISVSHCQQFTTKSGPPFQTWLWYLPTTVARFICGQYPFQPRPCACSLDLPITTVFNRLDYICT